MSNILLPNCLVAKNVLSPTGLNVYQYFAKVLLLKCLFVKCLKVSLHLMVIARMSTCITVLLSKCPIAERSFAHMSTCITVLLPKCPIAKRSCGIKFQVRANLTNDVDPATIFVRSFGGSKNLSRLRISKRKCCAV